MWLFRKLTNLISKLVVLNSFVILLVIVVAGLSVTNYACHLVNAEQVTGQALVTTLNEFLIIVSIIAFIFAGLLHYISTRRILKPIHQLTKATSDIKNGKIPSHIETEGSSEINELVENFNGMSKRLQDVQNTKDNMLRDIAHELRTPLTNMNGYLEALQNGVIEGDSDLFGSLLEESKRITRIVELLNELNNWNDGNHFLEKSFEQKNVDEVTRDILVSFQLKLKERFENYHCQLEQVKIPINEDGFRQVINNILQNIVDYNTGNELSIKGEIRKDQYLLTFTHSGQFIDPGRKDMIFERFYRFEESRSTKAKGAGLGLAIAKSIINAHHGTIGVDTDGTHHTFWITLPVKIG